MDEKERTEIIKEKINNWIKKPENALLIILLIFSLAVLLYYFNLTKDQTLWWDEAEYMSTAKHWAFNVPYEINAQRPPLIPFLAFLLFKLGFGEISIKFILEIIPAFLVVLFTYLLIIEMYKDKRIALIAALITSVSWIHLFYSMRFMTDAIGLLAGILAFYCFWRGYMNDKGKIYIWLIGIFVSLSFLSRLIGVLYGVLIVLFLVLTMQFKFLKNKHMWISFLISIATISPYLLWCYYHFGDALAFRSGYGGTIYSKLGWWMLIGFPEDRTQSLVYSYPEFVFFLAFLIGIITLLPMLLSLDRIILKKDRTFYNDFFILLNVVFTLAFFIYFLRQGENRWLIMMSVGIFTISAKGILLISDFAEKNLGKIISILVIIALLSGGVYYELKHADTIIKMKIPSYSEVKSSALWIHDNSGESDSVMTLSIPEMTYYTERKVYEYNNKNLSEVKEIIRKNHPTFFTFSPVYETHMLKQDIIPWLQENSQSQGSLFVPVYAAYMDPQKTQTGFIVFRINYDSKEAKEITE